MAGWMCSYEDAHLICFKTTAGRDDRVAQPRAPATALGERGDCCTLPDCGGIGGERRPGMCTGSTGTPPACTWYPKARSPVKLQVRSEADRFSGIPGLSMGYPGSESRHVEAPIGAPAGSPKKYCGGGSELEKGPPRPHPLAAGGTAGDYSLMRFKLGHGRPPTEIRCTCAILGSPILGDAHLRAAAAKLAHRPHWAKPCMPAPGARPSDQRRAGLVSRPRCRRSSESLLAEAAPG